MDLKTTVARAFGNGGSTPDAATLAKMLENAPALLAEADREAEAAQQTLDGLLTDADIGNPVASGEVNRARKALDAANAKARALRVMTDRAKQQHVSTALAEAQAAHRAHVDALKAADQAHRLALDEFAQMAKKIGASAQKLRDTVAAFNALVPPEVLDATGLHKYRLHLAHSMEAECFFYSRGAFPSARAVLPRMPDAFLADFTPMGRAYERNAAAAIERVEAAAPDALVNLAA